MYEEEEKSPILGSWRNVYILVVVVLIAVICALSVFTHYFQA